jgi:hypothetical protein
MTSSPIGGEYFSGSIPDGWNGEPLLIIFFVPSPVPLALPHGTTFNFERSEIVDWLRGVPRLPAPGLPPIPNTDANNFVSVKIWRPNEKLTMNTEPLNQALRVASAVTPGFPFESALPPLDLSDLKSGSTVFELVTPLILCDGVRKGTDGAVRDAFDRCLESLSELVRAYLIKSHDVGVTIPSPATLFPIIPFTSRLPDSSEWGFSWSAPLGAWCSLPGCNG